MRRTDVIFIAHRGESHDAPENTLAAINLAWARDDDAVEIDIRLSKDRTVVVFHDDNTQRITGIDKKVHDQTYEELIRLDVGIHKGERFLHERIPTLAQVLETVPGDKKLFIEIKDTLGILDETGDILDQSSVRPDQVVLMSFDIALVEKAKIKFPDRTVLWIVDVTYTGPDLNGAQALINKASLSGLDGLDVSACEKVNKTFVEEVKKSGMLLYVWTVNDGKEAKRLIDAGVDGITSNCACQLRKSLRL